ncbi:hypothetical protein D3C83_75750 [compost metagenome]
MFRCSCAPNATDSGTTSMCPPSSEVVADPPDGNITFFIFRISTPATFSATAAPWWLGEPRLVAMP